MSAGTYPVFLRLKGKTCLVVGAGKVGARKARGLLASGARVRVVSLKVSWAFGEEDLSACEVVERGFDAADLDGMSLVVAATDSESVNGEVVSAARARGVWVNDVTSADRSDFILPAIVNRGGLTIAVSTGGGSPAYARFVRETLEEEFGEEHAAMVNLLTELGPRVMDSLEPDVRPVFWEKVVTNETLDLIRSGQADELRERIERWLSS